MNDLWTDKVTDSYKTMFAYYYYFENPQPAKEKVQKEILNNRKAIGIDCGKFSYAEGPLSFCQILGVTGTLETLTIEQQRIIKDVYNF